MEALTVTMALLMGFTGSLHCAGMCGPIVWVLPFRTLKGGKKALAITVYHIGRISVYAFLAVVLFSFRSLFHPQWQQYISIILGVILLVVGVLSFLPGRFVSINMPWANTVKKYLGYFIANPGIFTLFIAGILNGLLPCGLVYMALSASVTAKTALNAAGLMYVFGVGTLPMLITLTVMQNKIALLKLHNVRKLVPVIMLALGSLVVLRGMNLGIPYLSPKVIVVNNEVRSCCSHHK